VTRYTDTEGRKIKPFETYLIGDWIGWNIPPEGSDSVGFEGILRVKGITVSEDNDTGDLKYVLDLHNAMLEHEIKLTQKVERMSQYSGGSDVLSVAPSSSSGYSTNEVNALLNSKANTVHHHAFTELVDTPETLAPGKIIIVNEEGNQLILDDREKPVIFFQGELTLKIGSNFKAEIEQATAAGNNIVLDIVNHRLIIGEPGKYSVIFRQIASTSGEAGLVFRRNGTGIKRALSVNAVRLSHSGALTLDCNTGDALDFYWTGTVTEALTEMDSSISIVKI